ncbi:MAG TPA: prohead protease/major capsid protein fusion protein, partial [Vicinamibacterales bacterium]|nr:prohead protease/major capsid protein fusion protein [Vicinamibacterales bacterium]
WSTQSQVAVVERASIEDGKGIATVRFPQPGVDANADRLFALVADKIVRNVSVGYSIDKVRIEKSETAGEVEKWFVERWTPHELSFVTVPADPGAQVRAQETDRLFPFEVINRAQPANQENYVMPEDTVVPGNAPAENVTTEAAPQPSVEQARAQERERITTITGLVSQFRLDRSVADDLVTRGVTVEEARKVVLDKLAERDSRGTGHSQVSMPAGGLDATVTRREAIAEAILHRAQPQAFQMTERAREYRGMRLLDIARDCLEAAGVRTRGMTPSEIAYQATRGAGLQSTSDFPLILAAVAGKRLRQAYAGTPRTFAAWARGVIATDFKPMYPTQVGNFPALKPVMEGAEFSYGSIAEGRESYQLATYGRIVALTRQAIVNDDLRAFDRAIGTAGQRAADLESSIVYNVLIGNANLADGVALFHANHGNLGTAGVIDEEALSEAWEKMTQQKDLGDGGGADKEYIDARPRFILVPPGQRSIEARKMLAATTPAKSQDVNPFAGSLQVVEEPRLFVSGGPQPWYLAADPNLVDTVEYAHLEGQTEPFIDQRSGFEVDGVEIKIRHDFAAKALDFRGLFKNAGANPS